MATTTSEHGLEALRQKYEPALRDMEKSDVDLVQILMKNDKLYIAGATHSKEALERVQRRFSQVDPNWSREVDLDLSSPGVLASHTGQTVVNHSLDFEQAADDTGESS